jgi:hypothetical protein
MSSKSPTKRPTKTKSLRSQASLTQSQLNESQVTHVSKPSEKVNLTNQKVEVDHLQGEIDLRQSKIDVTVDLQKQIEELR